jgi:hypothetical protein
MITEKDALELQRTRNGTPFRIYATDGMEPFVMHGAVWIVDGWLGYEWTAEGRVNKDGAEHDLDLCGGSISRSDWRTATNALSVS